MSLSGVFSAATVYLLYAMGAFPFAIWSVRAAYAATKANGRPGRAMTIFLVVLPILFALYYAWTSAGTPSAAAPGAFDPLADEPDDWVQALFFLLPPCLGLTAGYGLGWFMAARKR